MDWVSNKVLQDEGYGLCCDFGKTLLDFML